MYRLWKTSFLWIKRLPMTLTRTLIQFKKYSSINNHRKYFLKLPDFFSILCKIPWLFQCVQNSLTGKWLLSHFPSFPVFFPDDVETMNNGRAKIASGCCELKKNSTVTDGFCYELFVTIDNLYIYMLEIYQFSKKKKILLSCCYHSVIVFSAVIFTQYLSHE